MSCPLQAALSRASRSKSARVITGPSIKRLV
jgi:hypothetical protein